MTKAQQQIQSYKAKGMAAAAIATKLNSEHLKTPTGKRWSAKLVHATVANMKHTRVEDSEVSTQGTSEFAQEVAEFQQRPYEPALKASNAVEIISQIVDNPSLAAEQKLEHISFVVSIQSGNYSGTTIV